MESRLCKLIREFRELKEDVTRLSSMPLGTTGVPESYDHIISEIMDLIQVPKRQQELFWTLVEPEEIESYD